MSGIPKIIHRIWLGPKPVPDDYQAWWEAWQRQLPDYEFVTWTDSDIAKLGPAGDKVAEGRNFAEKSDIARYEIIRQFGGVYLDCDVMPLYRLDFSAQNCDFLHNICVAEEYDNDDGSKRTSIGCGNEFFAATPNHPALINASERIQQTEFPAESRYIDTVQRSGPIFWSESVLNNGVDQGVPLPVSAFTAYRYDEPFSTIYERDLRDSYGIHVWGNSWVPHDFQKQKLDRLYQYGDIRAIEAVLPKTGLTQKDYDNAIQQVINVRDARHDITVAASNSDALGKILSAPVNEQLYHPFKFFYSALAGKFGQLGDSCALWHFGAGDAAMAEEIRPILINCDPETLLIEERPQAQEQLRQDYRRNQNLKVIDAPASLEQLTALSGGKHAQTLIISEGARTLETLLGLLDAGVSPSVVILAQNGLSEPDWQIIQSRLTIYRIFHFDGFSCVYRKDVFFYYSSFLFIDHGIPGIFAPMSKLVFSTERPAS